MVCWQNTYLFLTSKLQYLMKSKCLSDVLFVVGKQPNQMKFHSHKFMVSIYSDVFHAMFNDPPCNVKIQNLMIIRIEDVEGHIFKKMLKFIYTEEIEDSSISDIIKLYFLAERYNILPLMSECKGIIEAQINPDNVCIAYRLALLINAETLMKKCENIIKTETTIVLRSDAFMKSSLEIIEKIASLDFLFIPNEVFLFDAILCWATEESKRQGIKPTPRDLHNIMYPIIPHIRFLSMTQEELFNKPVRSGIFKKEEIVDIAMHKSQPDLHLSLPKWCGWKREKRIESIESETTTLRICILCNMSTTMKKLHISCVISPSWTDFVLKGLTLCFKKSTETPTLHIFEQNKASRFIKFIEIDDDKSEKDNLYKIKLLEPVIMLKNRNYDINMSTVNPVIMCNDSRYLNPEINGYKTFLNLMNKTNGNCHISEIFCTIAKETIL